MYLHQDHTVQHLEVIRLLVQFLLQLDVIIDEDLPGRSLELGEYFKGELQN